MNSAYLHLVLNHIPIIATGLGVLLMVYAFVRKSDEAKQIALTVFVGSALVTIPVYLTGEPAEEIVEHLSGVSEAIIEAHEDAAFYSMILIEITGALAFLTLIFFRRSFGKQLLLAASLTSLAAAGSFLWTANLGGKIRHTEVRAGAVLGTETEAEKNEAGGEKEADDDDDDDH